MIDGQREELVGRIQKVYGISKDEAERQIERFSGGLDAGTSAPDYMSGTSGDRKTN